MRWDLSFITEEQLTELVRATLRKYYSKLESYDLNQFSKNTVDPIKLLFDKTVYHATWEETIKSEMYRRRNTPPNDYIEYFYRHIFQLFKNCSVPNDSKKCSWDVIYTNPDGVILPDGSIVHTVYIEIISNLNALTPITQQKAFIRMQNQLLRDDDCACFLVEAIAKKSQNTKWETTVDGQKVGHRLIRRVSMDKLYALVTGDENAFYKLCMVLPGIIQKVVDTCGNELVPRDTVMDELAALADEKHIENRELALAMAVYMLGFSGYNGFSD